MKSTEEQQRKRRTNKKKRVKMLAQQWGDFVCTSYFSHCTLTMNFRVCGFLCFVVCMCVCVFVFGFRANDNNGLS